MAKFEVQAGLYHPSMKLVDLHTHSERTDGWLTVARVRERLPESGLSGIAGTDHDNIKFGFDLRESLTRYPIVTAYGKTTDEDAVVGSEITAKRKDNSHVHIIGLFLEDNIPPYQSIGKTVEAIASADGVVVFPHPGSPDPSVSAATFQEIREVAASGIPVVLETYNSGMNDVWPVHKWKGLPNTNDEAELEYQRYRELYAGRSAGTDSHYRTIGRGAVAYEGDLREALLNGNTAVLARRGLLFKRATERLTPWDYIQHRRQLKRREGERLEFENGIIYEQEAA